MIPVPANARTPTAKITIFLMRTSHLISAGNYFFYDVKELAKVTGPRPHCFRCHFVIPSRNTGLWFPCREDILAAEHKRLLYI
jgi:hypothetical protein